MGLIHATRNWGHVVTRAMWYGSASAVNAKLKLPGHRDFSQLQMHRWASGCCDALGIRPTVDHPERLVDPPQSVIVANHLSQIDILVLSAVIEFDYRWLAKYPVFQVPFMGWHMHAAGHIPVYRGEARARNRHIDERIHDVIEEGASLLIFPEGTRSRDGHLKPFKIGAFMTAVKERLPILPVVIRGTHDLMRPGALDLQITAGRKCSVNALEAVPPPPDDGRPAKERARALRRQVYQRYLDQLYPGRVAESGEEDADARDPGAAHGVSPSR